MNRAESDTSELLNRVGRGDKSARERLFARHRNRLKQMVRVRMDRRLAARIDPSDIIQDVFVEADRGIDEFARHRPVTFYVWLRQLAWDRLVELHRQHVRATKRSVTREDNNLLYLPDESVLALADRLCDRGSSPSERLVRHELRNRIRAAIDQLSERDREVLVLRHLEQLTTMQTAAVLAITTSAVKARHVRALERLERLLSNTTEDRS